MNHLYTHPSRQRLSLVAAALLLLASQIGQAQSLSGQARTELGAGIEEATVTLTRAGTTLSTFTNSNGDYTFSGLTTGHQYKLCFSKNENPLNGVSTFDLKLLSDHLMNITLLNSPYKIIAGQTDPVPPLEGPDVGDLLQIRNLILGSITDLPVPSWKFIPADHVFPDPAQPYTPPPFPEGCKMVTVVGNTTGQDFIGVKTADFNNSAVPR